MCSYIFTNVTNFYNGESNENSQSAENKNQDYSVQLWVQQVIGIG